MKILLILPIQFYRYAISPLMAPHCRFYPTCSAYAEDAIRRHGPLRGSVLAAKRLLRCHPGTPGGYDPVPEIFAWRARPAGGVIPDATPSSPEANKAS